MKKTFRNLIVWLKKGHPFILGVTFLTIIVLVIILVMFLSLGYRFAIYDNIRPDWDAIGTIFSLFASIGAIVAAVFIPWKIAQQQNKIALFGIKHESYAEIHKLLCFADSISNNLFKKHAKEQILVSQALGEIKKPSAILNTMAVIFGF